MDPVLASGALAAGPFVSELEMRLEHFLPGRAAAVVSDVTQALAIALRLSGVGAGDDVMTLALNCLSSNTAISLVGASPIWVDVEPGTLTVDLADCSRALTPRTKALVVYHVAGYPADVVAIERFCQEHGLIFIEDANNALGARSGERKIGTGGRFSIVSFYANRQVNGVEGAALLCASPEDAEFARRLRRFGLDGARFRDADGEIAADVDVPEIGFPASMSNVNARLACHHIQLLDQRLVVARDNAAFLREALSAAGLAPISWRESDDPAFWTFLVHSTERDELMHRLKAAGVQCSKLHQRNDRYSGFSAPRRDLPGTTMFEKDVLALPVGWWVTHEQRDFIVDLVCRAQPAEG